MKSRMTAGGLLGFILLGGVVLRLWHFERDLWFDEAIGWRMNQFPWGELLERIARDNHPPLFTFLLKAWTALFGTSLSAMRSLSTVCAAGAILGVYLFAVEAYGPRGGLEDARKVGLLAAALAALSPLQAYWGAQIRMYALGMALAVFSSWALLRALRASAHRRAAWALYGGLALLFAYTHYFALFTLAAQALFIVGVQLAHGRGRALPPTWVPPGRGPLLALAIVVAGWLPWLPFFLQQRAQVAGAWWRAPLTAEKAIGLWYGMLWPPVVKLSADLPPSFPALRGMIFGALMLVALLGLLLWRLRPVAWYVVLAVTVPFASGTALSLFGSQNVLDFKYLFFAQLFVFVAVAALVMQLPNGWAQAVGAMLLLADNARMNHVFIRGIDRAHKPDLSAAARYLEEQRQPGDRVILRPYQYFPMQYYTAHPARWHIYAELAGQVPHFSGGGILTQDDHPMRPEDIQALRSVRACIVDNSLLRVPHPETWQPVSAQRFAAAYPFSPVAEVRCYQVPP
jgi:uncharacterized membrane protein